MKRVSSFFRLTNTVFAAAFFVFVLLNWVLPKGDYSRLENRMLKSFPKPTLQSVVNGKWESEAEEYLTDHLLLRSPLVRLRALVERLLGKTENNGVYFARDGYLIDKPGEWDGKEIGKNFQAILDLNSLDRFRITVCMVPPSYEILRDKLPANTYTYTDMIPSLNQAIWQTFQGTGIWVADCMPVLREHADEPLYYRTDHHQTSRASELLYRFLAEPLGFTPLGEEEFRRETVSDDFLGTTYSKGLIPVGADRIERYDRAGAAFHVSFPDEGKEADSLYFPDRLKEKDEYSYFLDGNHGLTVIEGPEKNGRRLAILKDSYAHSVVPFLANHFERIVMIDLRYFKRDLLQYLTEEQIEDVLFLYGSSSLMTADALRAVSDSALNSPYAVLPSFGRLEETESVGEGYFDDAVFVGDSLTLGFETSAGPQNADYLCSTSLSIGGLGSVDAPGGGSMLDALLGGDYRKIYVMLGINELVEPDNKEVFMEKYSTLLDQIKEAHPDAYVYLESMLPVSWSAEQDGRMVNEYLYDFNASLEQMAEEKGIFYLDIASAVSDENGYLYEEYTVDGVHLKPEYYTIWRDYLTNHAIADPTEREAAEQAEESGGTYDVGGIAAALCERVPFADTLGEIGKKVLCRTHGIDEELIAAAAGRIGGGATAEEITVIEAVSEEAAKQIGARLSEYVAERRQSYEGYLPQEVPKLEQPFLVTRGTLTVLVIADDCAEAQTYWNETADGTAKE